MNKNWSNTVLVAYSALPKIVSEIDSGVETRVKESFAGKHMKKGVSTYRLIDEILKLNDEKRKLVNLRILVADALNALPDAQRMILLARIVRRRTFQEIAKDCGIALRTAFRRFDVAENAFSTHLDKQGYGEDWLEKEYSEIRYISAIRERIMNDKYFIAKNM